jgi:hypothetical protein
MHSYSQVNLKHPLITAYKIDQTAQKTFKDRHQNHSSRERQDTLQEGFQAYFMQILRCTD